MVLYMKVESTKLNELGKYIEWEQKKAWDRILKSNDF